MDARGKANLEQTCAGWGGRRVFIIFHYWVLRVLIRPSPQLKSVFTLTWFYVSLLLQWFQKGVNTTVFVPHTHSAYGINQTVKKILLFYQF